MRLIHAVCAAAALALHGCGSDAEAPAADAAPRALVLITVDTLRAEQLGSYGSDRGLTPNLDAWAASGLTFDAAYAPAPLTVPALVSLHTGRHPLELGFQINTSVLSPDAETLAEQLAARGWKTAAVVSNVVLRKRGDLAQGFEIWDDLMTEREVVRQWPERIAARTTDAALALLALWQRAVERPDAPLFLWVHYQDPHGPYTPPPGFRERTLEHERARDPQRLPVVASSHGEGGIPQYQQIEGETEAAFYRAGYFGEIAYLDREIGRLLDALGALENDTVVAFAADHGEALGENDLWFAHANDLTDPLVRVPLVLRLPGVASDRRSDVVRLADLYPTLLRAALGDAATPLPELPGAPRDLLAPDAETRDSVPLLTTLEAYPHRRIGIVADGYKLILTQRDGVWVPRLFRSEGERADLAAAAPQVVSTLRERLWELYEARAADGPAPLLEVGEEQRRHLEALGYVPEPVR